MFFWGGRGKQFTDSHTSKLREELLLTGCDKMALRYIERETELSVTRVRSVISRMFKVTRNGTHKPVPTDEYDTQKKEDTGVFYH